MRNTFIFFVLLVVFGLPCAELPEHIGLCDDAWKDFVVTPGSANISDGPRHDQTHINADHADVAQFCREASATQH
jgi:hypothetical protein